MRVFFFFCILTILDVKVIDELMSKHVLKKSTPPLPPKKKKKEKKILAQVYCVIGWVRLDCKCVCRLMALLNY